MIPRAVLYSGNNGTTQKAQGEKKIESDMSNVEHALSTEGNLAISEGGDSCTTATRMRATALLLIRDYRVSALTLGQSRRRV